ncbi:MAG TPA: HAD-IC family P-type ATPase, partial [Micromonosporaceae bacterium]
MSRGTAAAVRDELAGRRVWATGQRAYVEARGLHDVEVPPAYVADLERQLAAANGVRWAAVNGVLGDVIVDFDPELIAVDELRRIVGEVEHSHGMAGRRRDRPIHPSDFEQVFDRLIEIAGDLLGTALGLAGQVAPALRLPAEAMALPAAIDLLAAQLKQRMERRFGAVRVELVLSLLSSALSATTQSPLSTLVDAALRAVELPEALASRGAWERRANDLAATYELARAEPLPSPGPRAVPLPKGAADRYSGRARTLTELAAAPLLVAGGVRQAARAVLVGAPKAATMGTDAFSAELGRLLAGRGVVVREPDALRCLDRVDTVVLDASALTTGRMTITAVATGATGAAADRAKARVRRMFDPEHPMSTVRDGHWRLAPLTELGLPVPPDLSGSLRAPRDKVDATLGLARDRRLIAMVGVTTDTDPLLDVVVSAAHQLGRVVIAPARRWLVDKAGADGTVAGGSRLAASVRALQQEGHVVAVVAGSNEAALIAADCGIGVMANGSHPPWAAHVLCGPGLADAWLILQAAKVARANADRGANLALLGAVTGAAIGFLGPERTAGRRGTVPVNLAALASILAGVWSANRLGRQPVPVPGTETPWHALAVEETLRELRTTRSGLSDEQANERGGPEPGQEPEAESFVPATIAELNNPLTGPLVAGAALSAATGSIVDAGLVAAVLAGNAALGAAQRVAASRAVRTLSAAGEVKVRLRRNGIEYLAPATELVAGDVILLQAGDVVPADCRLIDASQLETDESSLTGESMLVAKDPGATRAEAVADRSSMLYAGTTVAAGTATAVVVATGLATEGGRGTAAAQDAQAPGGVEAKLARLTSASIPVAAAAAGSVLAGGLLRGRIRESLPSAVALAVAAVPEGLPFVATAAQLAASRRLSRHEVLVRSPRTLEALGRVDVVCFDKTGTLTEGSIDLSRISDGQVDETVDALTGARRMVLASALRASPAENGGDILPHPTDRAVNRAGEVAGVERGYGEPGWRLVRELPFEPGRGFHAVLGRSGRLSVISVKGAPETVLPRCLAVRDQRGVRPMTSAIRRRLARHAAQLGDAGYRVLAVAERSASNRRELGSDRVERMEFLGFLGLSDSVRPTAATAIGDLRRAGVDVVMLTGDHPNTAAAVAAELGLLDGRPPVTGPELEAADQA